MRLRKVEFDDVPNVWPEIEPWIARALASSLGYLSVDILVALLKGEMQLWVADDGKICGCCITHFVRYPRCKTCWVLACGGEGVDDFLPLLAGIEDWARSCGCVAIEEAGRAGWVRKMKDYTPVHTVLRKVLR